MKNIIYKTIRHTTYGRWFLLFWLALAGLIIPEIPVQAQEGGVAGIQEYFIPGTQAQMLETFNDILQQIDEFACVSDALNNCITIASADWETLIESRVSIVAYDNASAILIDRAANGYVAAGDYDPAHYDAIYNLNKGDVLTLDHLGHDLVVGGDRIVSVGGPIFVVRAGWPTFIGRTLSGSVVSPGQVLAGYWELYPTAVWATEYGSPMGETGLPGHVDDLATTAVVQAKIEGTTIQRNGSVVTTLNRGQSYLIEDIQIGDKFTGNQPISVSLVTSGLQNVAMRFFSLTPFSLTNHEYIIPLNSMHFTDSDFFFPVFDLMRLYIYAYDATNYTIYEGSDIVATGFLNAGETATHATGNTQEYETDKIFDNGVRVVADEASHLQVLATMDSQRALWDWGFPVVGSKYLVNEYYLAWSPASGPNYPSPDYRGPGHPVFVSPAADNTAIQVDWDNDDEVDETIVLDQQEWIALLDETDLDNTGGHLTGSGPFALVWGEDILASPQDGYDLGYSILPQTPEFFEEALLELDKLVSPESSGPGGIFGVELTLTAGPIAIENVAMTDKLPTADFSYYPNSTRVHYPTGEQRALQPTIVNQELTWDIKDPNNPGQDYDLPANQSVRLTFDMAVAAPYRTDSYPDTQVNNAVGFGQWNDFEFQPTAFDFVEIVDRPSLTVIKEAAPESPTGFFFSSTVPGHSNFTLIDDGESLDNQQIFANLNPGTYQIQEDIFALPTEFWALLSITCQDEEGQPATAEVNLAQGKVDVTVGLSEHIKCTFVNENATFYEGAGTQSIYLPLILK